MPVRQVSNKGGNTIGKYPSLKLNRMVAYESILELDVIHLLEFSQAVTSYEEQPFKILYEDENGKKRHYTPDFYVQSGKSQVVIEVKPQRFVAKPDNQRKFLVASKWCTEKGVGFQVVTDELLHATPRTANIKFLSQFSRYAIPHQMQIDVLNVLASLTGFTDSDTEPDLDAELNPSNHPSNAHPLLVTHSPPLPARAVPIGDAIVKIAPENPQTAVIPILHMAYCQHIPIDLNDPEITTHTHIWR